MKEIIVSALEKLQTKMMIGIIESKKGLCCCFITSFDGNIEGSSK